MNEIPREHPSHPDELLPWLVNGTLSDEERQDIESHLEICQTCQQEVLLLQKMRAQVKDSPSQSPGEVGLNRLLKEVQRERTALKASSLLQPKWWRTGLAIAASLIIFVQAGLLIDAWYLSKPVMPLAGPQLSGSILQISFVPTATEAEIRQVVNIVHGTFVDGPSQLGIYRIRLALDSPQHQSIEQTIEQLRQHTAIIQHIAKD